MEKVALPFLVPQRVTCILLVGGVVLLLDEDKK
jgi:hypothetical protein